MISLIEVDQSNFDECTELKRKSERFVGSAAHVLAEAYVHRRNSTAYGIYENDVAVGLVILRDRPDAGQAYAFTNLFIADHIRARATGAPRSRPSFGSAWRSGGRTGLRYLCMKRTKGRYGFTEKRGLSKPGGRRGMAHLLALYTAFNKRGNGKKRTGRIRISRRFLFV
jgi:hypothetical protein